MKKSTSCLLLLWFTVLLSFLLVGCGSSSDSKTTSRVPTLLPASTDFPNAGLLVSADSLQKSLNAKDLVIIDARTSGYENAHIPKSVNLKYTDFFTSGTGLLPQATLEAKLSQAGLSRGMTFVIYDDTTASFGAAGRIFWMLEYLGCEDVHILDGGWDKWITDGRPTETKVNSLRVASFVAEVRSSVKASSKQIAYRLYDKDFAVIDTRTDEEFTGWQLYGEPRGGHIAGAVQMPYAWFFNSDKTTISYNDLKVLLTSKGITPDKEITAYCTVGIRSAYMYFLLRLMGYERISNYDASIMEWAGNPDLPMEKAPRFSTVVYPSWVKSLIDYHKSGSTTPPPPEYPYDRNHKYVIFETQWGSFEDMEQGWADNSYLLGHLPGAIHSNSDIYENGYPRWFLIPDSDLHIVMGSMGITQDTTVVVYSNSRIFAARLWWILKYAGVKDVRFLNGGYEGWTAAGYDAETKINYPVSTTFIGSVRPEYIASTDYVFSRYTNTAGVQIMDVRTGSEYAGIISGYSYLAAKGRIPNAIWAYDADDSSAVYDDNDSTLRSYTEIRALWDSLGIKSTMAPNLFDKDVIIYCGSGYRSAIAFLYAYLMGYDNVRNYSDGWEGWSTTYIEDPNYNGPPTPGWQQLPSGRPFLTGW